MKIEIDVEKLLDLEITPNQYVLAFLIHEGRADEFLRMLEIEGENKIKDDLFRLYSKDYIENEIEHPYLMDFSTMRIKKLFKDKPKYSKQQLETFFNDWHDLFPAGIKTGNVLVKSNKKDCISKLEKFMRRYPEYDLDTILNATRNYIERLRLENYKFMKAATYFISKNNESQLASECEHYLQVGQTVNTNIYGTRRG